MAETLQITSQGQGIPIVFIHGWGLNSGIWQPLATKLAAFYKVITIDLPGYGVNIDKTLSPYSLENICQQVVAAVGEPAVYAGWSLGGLVATEISATYRDKSLGLISIASSPCFLEQASADDEANHFWPGIKAPLLAAFHQQLAKDTHKTIDGFLKLQAMGSPHIRQDLKQIRELIFQYPLANRQILDDSLALLETVDLREKLSTITLPFLRLYGRLDSLVPKTVPALVDKLAANSESHILKQASHAPFISHADEFIEVLSLWLNKNYT